jgi:hypothetical protein
VVRSLRSHPSAILLGAQLLSVLAFPFMEDTTTGRALFSAVGIMVLSLALLSVTRSPIWTAPSLVLAVPAVVLLVVEVVSDAPQLVPWTELLLTVLYLYAAVGLIVYMLADQHVTVDELFAVGATFTLVAWAFAHLYTWCQVVYPDSFTAALPPGEPRTWMELLFVSFTTLSGTGLSDIVPVHPFARALVMLEQVAGVGYIVMVVSRLVTLLPGRRY